MAFWVSRPNQSGHVVKDERRTGQDRVEERNPKPFRRPQTMGQSREEEDSKWIMPATLQCVSISFGTN